MSERERATKWEAAQRQYQAVAFVHQELAAEGHDAASLKDQRINWLLTWKASDRLNRQEFPEGQVIQNQRAPEEDVNDVRDTICVMSAMPREAHRAPDNWPLLEQKLAQSIAKRCALHPAYRQPGHDDGGCRVLLKGLSEPISLDDALAITSEWKATNRRRAELIVKESQGELCGKENEAEAAELDRLQRLASIKRKIVMPLPVLELAQLGLALESDRERED